jgi:glycosyltransferase involved in cell wall biosynthesis
MLAWAIISLLTNRELGSRLGAAARQQAERRFGLERLIEEVGRLYEELLAKRASKRYS